MTGFTKSAQSVRDALLLYGVTDKQWLKGRSLEEVVQEALSDGVTAIQYRAKDNAFAFGARVEEALQLKELCQDYAVPLIINDDVELALQIQADGVHLGQEDMACPQARELLGPDKIVGVTAKTLEQAIAALEAGADYLGVGSVFGSVAKPEATPVTLETLKLITATVSIPVVAIGGINLANIFTLKGTGIAGVAVVSALFAAPDIALAARDLLRLAREVAS